jgi:hypothetical protein
MPADDTVVAGATAEYYTTVQDIKRWEPQIFHTRCATMRQAPGYSQKDAVRLHKRNESQHMGPAGWHAMSPSRFASPCDELDCDNGCLLGCLLASSLSTVLLVTSV